MTDSNYKIRIGTKLDEFEKLIEHRPYIKTVGPTYTMFEIPRDFYESNKDPFDTQNFFIVVFHGNELERVQTNTAEQNLAYSIAVDFENIETNAPAIREGVQIYIHRGRICYNGLIDPVTTV